MVRYISQRAVQAIIVVAIVSALVFVAVYAIGNPIDVLISPDATQRMREQTIANYGLDQPLYAQYFVFIKNMLAGNMGRSFVFGVPVLPLIMSRLPATLELTLAAMLIATVVGVPLGIYAGTRPNNLASRLIMAMSVLSFSVPTFWIGLILILVFAINLGWLPAGGRGETVTALGVQWSFLTIGGLKHLLLPALNLALFNVALMIRLARAGTRETMLTDVIKFARATGLTEHTILRRHVLKLISVPIVTVFGLEFGSTLAYAVVTETIFSWPGVGKLILDSITSLDRPVMVAYLILIAVLFVAINFSVDIVYAFLDPRLRRREIS
jgi:peptide/nickel transport system permease protein